jgi:hypothetical protein
MQPNPTASAVAPSVSESLRASETSATPGNESDVADRMFGSTASLLTTYGSAFRDATNRLCDATGMAKEERDAHIVDMTTRSTKRGSRPMKRVHCTPSWSGISGALPMMRRSSSGRRKRADSCANDTATAQSVEWRQLTTSSRNAPHSRACWIVPKCATIRGSCWLSRNVPISSASSLGHGDERHESTRRTLHER